MEADPKHAQRLAKPATILLPNSPLECTMLENIAHQFKADLQYAEVVSNLLVPDEEQIALEKMLPPKCRLMFFRQAESSFY